MGPMSLSRFERQRVAVIHKRLASPRRREGPTRASRIPLDLSEGRAMLSAPTQDQQQPDEMQKGWSYGPNPPEFAS